MPSLKRYRLRYELLNVRRVLIETDDRAQVDRVMGDIRPFAVLEPRMLLFVDDLVLGVSQRMSPDTPF